MKIRGYIEGAVVFVLRDGASRLLRMKRTALHKRRRRIFVETHNSVKSGTR